ncbi:MAG: carboxypeptidase-like regulatory domain-containing protein [Ardenticatenia bacterium]|nr:carboxypeptidase-like regulatory domain-containing protein [Ardenticatenia bacterium]
MKPSRFWRFGLVLGVTAVLLAWSALIVYAQGGTISGVVSSPLGYPLPAGTVVKLYKPGSEDVYGMAHPDIADGRFQIGPVPNGLYVVRAVPPTSSGLTPSLPKAVSVFGGNANVGTLVLTTPQITGTVVAPDGITPVTATVHVYAGGTVPVLRVEAPGGQFALGGLVPGSYAVEARRATADPFWRSARRSVTVPGTSSPLTLTLRQADLWGVVVDETNAPVNGARVGVANRGGVHAVDYSGPAGFWAVGGLTPGTYWVGALPPPYAHGLVPSTPVSTTVPGAAAPMTLTLETPPQSGERHREDEHGHTGCPRPGGCPPCGSPGTGGAAYRCRWRLPDAAGARRVGAHRASRD